MSARRQIPGYAAAIPAFQNLREAITAVELGAGRCAGREGCEPGGSSAAHVV